MRHPETLPSVVDAIGETPLVELSRIARGLDGRLLAKLEYLNPGHSKKDRIARQILADARADGSLRPGQTVVELTSGNTGTGLAIVCSVEGHPFVAVMSRGNSRERALMMRALGAEVVLVDQVEGSEPGRVSGADLQRVEEVAQRICQERGAFRADQFCHPGALRAHEQTTAEELWRQSGHSIDAFCDFVGSGSSLGGCAAALKRKNPGVLCYAIEPAGAPVLAGRPVTDTRHPIQGGGYSRTARELPLLDLRNVDGYLTVSGEVARETARRLARDEGILAGFSSGANVAGALELLSGPCLGRTVAVLLCDSGLKYLSTDLYAPG
jgi:cysteine synthase